MTSRIALASAVALLSAVSSAQVASAEAGACNPQVAQMLVEQQVAESKSVTARPKRVKILLRSADFLWPLDQPTARAYFIEAFTNAKEHFAEKGFEKANVQRTQSGSSTYTNLPDLRSDVIRAVSTRDPELARKFADEVLAEFEKAVERDIMNKTREQDDLLGLAGESAGADPEFARFLYRRLMRFPLVQSWFWSLNTAARRNQALADSIYAEALRNYRNEKPGTLLFLSAYPFGVESNFGQGRFSFTAAPMSSFVPNVTLQRSFLDTFFARVASFTGNPEELNAPVDRYSQPEATSMVTALRDMEPLIIERFPDMLHRFSVARSQANSALSAEMRKNIEDQDKSAAGGTRTFDESIEALENADSKGTLTDYMIAKILFDRRMRADVHFAAYQRWIAKIKEETTRAEITNYYWFSRTQLAIKEKRYPEAEKMAAKVPELDHRAILLFDIAKILLESASDVSSGFDTLNGVSKLARSAPNSVAKAQVLFNLVHFYERVNHSLALDELAEAVRVVNRLDEPELFQNWVSRRIAGKDFAFMASISLPGNNLEGMFTEMGKKDFEMAIANARGFDDKYFRTISLIAIAKNCVATKPPAAPRSKN